jgi:hypothetical protein
MKRGISMKIYDVYIIDNEGIGGVAKFKANNKTEARAAARQYIRAWKLGPATIQSIEEAAPTR